MKTKLLVSIILSILIVVSFSACTDTHATQDPVSSQSTPVVSEIEEEIDFNNIFKQLRADKEIDGWQVKDGYVYGINYSTPIGSIHTHGADVNGTTIYRDGYCEFVYDSSKSIIYKYSLGQVKSKQLPYDTSFTFISNGEVYYRVGSEIYWISTDLQEGPYKVVDGVKSIISPDFMINYDYEMGTEVRCPLFLMDDDRIKIWYCEELQDIDEGGFTRIDYGHSPQK